MVAREQGDGAVISVKDYPDVYPVEPDTQFIMDTLQSEAAILRARRPMIVVEVGCGNAAVSVLLSRLLGETSQPAPIFATDISAAAVSASQETAASNRATLLLARMDLLTALRPGTVDLLVFHPPYVATTQDLLTKASSSTATQGRAADIAAASWTWAGGPRGRVVLDRLVADLHRLLSPSGAAFLLFYEAVELVPDLVAKGLRAQVVSETKHGDSHFFLICCELGL